jgi:hypothetical protein
MGQLRISIFAASFCYIMPGCASAEKLTADDMAVILGTFVTQNRVCPEKISPNYLIGREVLRLGYNIADFLPGGRYEKLMSVRIEKAVEFIKMHGLEFACRAYKEYLVRYLKDAYE